MTHYENVLRWTCGLHDFLVFLLIVVYADETKEKETEQQQKALGGRGSMQVLLPPLDVTKSQTFHCIRLHVFIQQNLP